MRNRPRFRPSPEVSALLSASRLSRRTLMRGALASGALLTAGAALGACGTRGAQQTADSCVSEDLSDTEKTINFSNWPQYIDVDEEDESKRPTLEAFREKTGIEVTYNEDVNDNTEFFGKVQNQLGSCQPTGRDIMVLTDWMAARMIRLGWLQKLDKSRLPNVEKNLLPSLRGRPFDRNGEYAVPWQSGLAGLAYNARVTKEIRSVDELLTRPDLKGKVTVLSEMRDTMGLIMLGWMLNMYKNAKANIAVVAVSVLLLAGGVALDRSQVTVGDTAFMRAMIPHHSLAITRSERAQIDDVRVCELAVEIIEAQQREIAEMDWLIEDIEENGLATTSEQADARPVPDFTGTALRSCPVFMLAAAPGGGQWLQRSERLLPRSG